MKIAICQQVLSMCNDKGWPVCRVILGSIMEPIEEAMVLLQENAFFTLSCFASFRPTIETEGTREIVRFVFADPYVVLFTKNMGTQEIYSDMLTIEEFLKALQALPNIDSQKLVVAETVPSVVKEPSNIPSLSVSTPRQPFPSKSLSRKQKSSKNRKKR